MKQDYWSRLDSNLGAYTIYSLEQKAGLGSGTLRKARENETTPKLEVTLQVSRVLGIDVRDLLGDETPPELNGPAPDDAIRRIKLANLTASYLNPRRTFDEDALAELAESIAAQGLLQNLVARQDKDQPAIYWIVAGERRYRALELLRTSNRLPADLAAGIPCRVIEGTDEEHVVLALLENMQRQNVNPMEEAEALARLHSLDPKKWSTANIAAKIGVTQRQVQHRLQLATKLTDDAKEKLRTGEISVTQARAIAAAPAEVQTDLLIDALEGAQEADLLERSTWDMMEADFAWFDVEKSGLETYTNTDGKVFVVDEDGFKVAQQAAVDAKRKELLAGGTPWVAIEVWYDSKAYPEGGDGALIVFTPNTGRAELFIGRRKPAGVEQQSTVHAPSQHARTCAAERQYHEDRVRQADRLVKQLAEQMSFDEALQIYIWDSVVDYQAQVLSGSVEPGILMNGIASSIGADSVDMDKPKSAEAAWEALCGIKDGRLRNGFVELVAASIIIHRDRPLSPVLANIAAACKVIVPTILLHTDKQRAAAIKALAEKVDGQTELEDAIAEAAQ